MSFWPVREPTYHPSHSFQFKILFFQITRLKANATKAQQECLDGYILEAKKIFPAIFLPSCGHPEFCSPILNPNVSHGKKNWKLPVQHDPTELPTVQDIFMKYNLCYATIYT